MTSPELGLKSNNSVCPRCGTGLRCGMVGDDAKCWCVNLPHVMPVPSALPDPVLAVNSAASCFCPACLEEITNERKNALSSPAD